MPPPNTPALPRTLASTIRTLVFAVPLVALILGGELFFGHMLYPHVTWRNFVFRMVVETMFGLWVVLAWLDPQYRPRKTPLLLALSVFVAFMVVADLLGVNPRASLWSNHERMEGLIGLLHMFGFFLVAGSVLNRRAHWKTFFLVCLGVCLFVCGDAFWQLIEALRKRAGEPGIGRVFLQEVPPSVQGRGYLRVDARLASPVYLGVYMVLHFFVAVVFWLRARRERRWMFAAMAVMCLLVLGATQTRIAWAGLVIGAGVALGLLAFLGEPQQRRRAGMTLAVLTVVSLITALALLLDVVPLLNRLSGEDVESATGVRLAIWKMVWQGFLEHPLLGWGQENFSYIYAKYFDPVVYGAEIPSWWDHPHNVFFNWLMAGGLPGLLLYVGVFVAAGRILWKDSPLPLAERCAVTGLLVGYVVFNSAQLDNLISYLLFFAVLAWLHALRVQQDREATEETATPPRRNPALAVAALTAAGVGVGVAIYQLNVIPMRAAMAVSRMSVRLGMYNDGLGGLQEARRALEARRIGYGEVRRTVAEQTSQVLLGRLDTGIKWQMLDLARQAMDELIEGDPQNLRALTTMGNMLNSAKSPEAAEYLERAREISPRRQELCFELGRTYVFTNRPEKAVEMFRTGWKVREESDRARLFCAMGAVLAGDAGRVLEEEALASMRADQAGAVFQPPLKFVEQLRESRRWDTMIELLEPVADLWRGRRVKGKHISAVMKRRLLQLVAAYRESGRKRDAVVLLTEMIQNDPKFAPRGRQMRSQIKM